MLFTTWILPVVCLLLLWRRMLRVQHYFRKVVLHRHSLSMPRGPMRLPILGSCYVFRSGLANNIHKLSQVYGSVFTVYALSSPTICINKTDLIKKVCLDPRFQCRPVFPKIGKLFGDKNVPNGGLILCNGERWRRNRSVAMRHLRTNVSHPFAEEIYQSEVSRFIARIRHMSEGSRGFNPCVEVVVATASILSRSLFGESAPVGHPCLRQYCINLMKLLHGESGVSLTVTMLKHFPWLDGLPLPGFNIIRNYDESLSELFGVFSAKRQNDANCNENETKTILDAYMEAFQGIDCKTNKRHLIDELLLIVSDLYIGGTDTTSCSILHAVRVLAAHKQYQDRIFSELQENVTGVICARHLRDMHFTNAFLHEILRMEPAASAGIARRVTEDAIVDGVRFPKGVTVLCNIYGAHREEKYWENPGNFNPNRFLDEAGEFRKGENFISFSYGRRRCPGESLALKEVFFMVATVVKYFEILPPADGDLNMGMRYGLTSFPHDFKVRFKSRQ